jgi:lipopolysaccharide transport system ATP-binding protein
MGDVSGEGRTVLLVSHNMSAITSLATRCLWLDAGRVRALGATEDVVGQYLSSDFVSQRPGFADLASDELRRGDPKRTEGDVRFDWVRLRDKDGETANVFFTGDPLRIELGLRSRIGAERLELLVIVKTLEGVLVFTLMSGLLDVGLEPGEYELSVDVPWNQLRPGRYALDLYALTGPPQDYVRGAIQFEVAGPGDRGESPRDHQHWGLVNVEQDWSALRPRLEEPVAALPPRR